MERIGFSLAGEGRGHAARVVALSQVLRGRYEIVYFCPEPARDFIVSHIPDARIEPVPALNFVKNGHGIDYFKTLLTTIRSVRTLKRDISDIAVRIRESEIRVLISDFEPYASWGAARCEVPVLNLNHPGVILKFLSLSPVAWLAQLVATLMMPPARKTIICSFYRGDVGPIIRRELKDARPERGEYYLVYTKESSRDRVKELLSRFPEERFRIFPDPGSDFTESLIGCRGVIAPAGHQLISESLFLGKPVLAIPQTGQYEQRLNARMLRASGGGMSGRFGTLERDIAKFITSIDSFHFRKGGPEMFRSSDDTLPAARMIESFIQECGMQRTAPRFQYNWFSTVPEKIDYLFNPESRKAASL
jgi:uncharacterized protein (TIGR00661 family)